MKGLLCQKCGKSFPALSELSQHECLYSARVTYSCNQCDVEYYTMVSLKLHQMGKHGEGYICQQCGL